jgi:hypothetical protein
VDEDRQENNPVNNPQICSFQSLDLEVPRTVRLLHLLPSLDYKAAIRVRGRLETISLDAKPKYNAISYTWGSREESNVVIIEDSVVSITANLMDVLRTLCAQRQGQTTSLWIDAVCINQENHHERTHQINLIRDIFAGAQEVLLCIGPGNDHDDEAIADLRTISAQGSAELNETLLIAPHRICNIVKLLESEFWERLWHL